ncbi:MAG: alkane 1-monooxygenase [Caulobacteraceae bacterium]|nr:alkane 1-monooxygenase [Caulobacteraceae bacterium]
MVSLSILDLGRVRQGASRREALETVIDTARHAEALGYQRLWVAEHHNMPGVATAATAVVIGQIAAATTTLRVGAGGVMLPNHAPLIIAEQFGTLATLFPGRIDLGLGRAPGTDGATLQALRRDYGSADRFPQDVLELQAYLAPLQEGQRIEAVPGSGTEVPLWILGSSLFGAQLAAELGLPFGFASHFAPQALDQALDIYRSRFKPSDQQAQPYALIGVNIIAADSDEAARRLATSQQMAFANMVRGQRGLLSPPIEDIETYWSAEEKLRAGQMLACSIIGGPDTVRAGVQALVERTGADELMVVSDIYDLEARRRSFTIIAEAA